MPFVKLVKNKAYFKRFQTKYRRRRGDIINSLLFYDGSAASLTKLDEGVRDGTIKMCIIGVVSFIASYGEMSLWMLAGENQTKRIREHYFKAVLRQDVGWFDKTSTGELTNRMNADMALIQDGLSDKVGLIFQFTAAFIAGFVIAFTKGWELALVLCCVFPVLAGAAFVMSKVLAEGSNEEQASYAEAGGVAQQVLSSMRTVAAFGGESREVDRYSKHLDSAERFGIKKAMFNGIGVASIQGLIFLVYALAFWYGNRLIPDKMNAGQVLNVFFAIIIGAFSLGNATPHIAVLGTAQGAAYAIFETIDRVSPIDPSLPSGERPDSVKGKIEFKNIDFHYPARDDVKILKDFNLTVPAGKTVALVGASGSGKSTIVKLVERFYDPVGGSVLLDDRNIKDLNLTWLRQQIGIVSQEPSLFETSIRQNILYGLKDDGSSVDKSKLDSMVENACRMANAWEFIQKLPKGLDTDVGEAGSMLSGGQKQRIAIARAIIKDPKILLLDEATSALDTESERIVQAALERASENRTTIVIAHRLSTVKNADVIIVMNKGVVIETGNHNSLLEQRGVYYELVEAQKLHARENTGTVNPESNQIGSADDTAVSTQETKSNELAPVETRQDQAVQDASNRKKSIGSIKSHASQKPGGRTSTSVEQKDAVAADTRKVDTWRLIQLNRPEWGLYFLGFLGAVGNGVVMPLFSILFSSILTSLGSNKANFWALMFVILAVGAFISNFLQIALFRYSGEKLTRRLRAMTFTALVRQEISYFDEPENSTGALTSKLAEDASLVKGVTGLALGAIVQSLAGMVSGLTIAFSSSWQLSLVIIGLVPLIGFAGYFQMQALVGYGKKSREAYDGANQTANEAISTIRTVLTLTQEHTFYKRFLHQTHTPHLMAVRGIAVSSFGFALSQSVMFWAWAVAFYYGSRLIVWGLYDSQSIIKVMFAIIFTAISTGQISQYTPDMAKARLAALAIFDIVDRVSKINPTEEVGEKRDKAEGIATARNVVFAYPTRPQNKILTGLSIEANPGKTVALVGRSGCGKSTILGLLERWYDVSDGVTEFESLDVRKWNLRNLRSHMALVGQEPILFNTTIKENIAYGAIRDCTDADIVAAAKLANIHEFVVSLPKGYDTLVGERGGQLSGGQKQRIAIARALIRNPKLLLLDEATSALDSESEKVVQAALDAAAKGRTTIVIAHRLSTIQNADVIYVVNGGKVVEKGTHFELVDKRGEYFELVNQQMLNRTDDAQN